MLRIGEKAPMFTLPDQDGEKVRLTDLKGSFVVLYFYPKDDTAGCTKEACEFSEGVQAFRNLDAVVVGVSPDSPESHRKFIAKHGLALTLLSDPEHTVLRKYEAWGEKNLYGRTTEGVIRSTVLIDPTGKIAYHWPKVKAAGHAAQVRQKLEELRGMGRVEPSARQ